MIEILKGSNEEYLQCSSCLKGNFKDNDNTDMFKLIIGKSMRQTTIIKLCDDCLKVLKNNIEQLKINGIL